MKLAALFLLISFLSGCMYADYFSPRRGEVNDAYNAMPPLASAGADQAVPPATLVTLEGRGTYQPGGGRINMRWQQVLKGTEPVVMLSSAFSANPTFLAPLTECVLTFTLEAGDGRHCTYDEVRIVVTNDIEQHGLGPIVLAGADRLAPFGARPGPDDIVLDSGNARFERVRVSDCSIGAGEDIITDFDSDFSIWALTGSDNGLSSAPDYLFLFDESTYYHAVSLPEITALESVSQALPGQELVLNAVLSQNLPSYQYLRWQQLRGAVVDVKAADTSMSFKLPMEVQQLAFIVTVTDGEWESAPYLYKINVSPLANDHVPLPVAPLRVKGHVGQIVTIDGQSSYDYDGDPLTFSWQQLWGGPADFITSADAPTLSFIAPENPTTLVFKLKVCDYQICAESAAIVVDIVDISDNSPPKSYEDYPVIANQEGELTVVLQFDDPEQDEMSHLSCKFYGTLIPYLKLPSACNEQINDGATEVSCLFLQTTFVDDAATDGDGVSDTATDSEDNDDGDATTDGSGPVPVQPEVIADEALKEYFPGSYALELSFDSSSQDLFSVPMNTSYLYCSACDKYDSCANHSFPIYLGP